jgi:GNAT superfamily N-acetyltransferase
VADNLPGWVVRPARPDQYFAAVELLVGPGDLDGRLQRIAEWLDHLRSGVIDPAGLFVAEDATGCRGAILGEVWPSRLGSLTLPDVAQPPAELIVALTRTACDWLLAQGCPLLQVQVDLHRLGQADALERAGFYRATTIQRFSRSTEPWPTATTRPSNPLTLRPIDSQDAVASERFLHTFRQSGEQSLDVPEIVGVADMDDLLRDFHPQQWRLLAWHQDSPVGVLILEPAERAHTLLLAYLGLVPGWRGQGLGVPLVVTAVEQARQLGADWIELCVDERNLPASRSYARAGFRVVGRRALFLRRAEAADPPP